jgi:prepilin-type N-terminal cleavage/methylation domain-containing protein
MTRRDRGFTVMEVLIVIVIIAIVAAIAIPGMISTQRSSYERNAATSLKTLCIAQHDFRANDREGNHVNDFWTADVKGLYTLTNAQIPGAAGGTTDPPIRLIELSIAVADVDAATPPAGGENMPVTSFGVCAAKAGYWYASLMSDMTLTGAEASYRQDTLGIPNMGTTHHYTKFGIVTFPDSTVFGKFCFITNEANTIYRCATTGPVRAGNSTPPGYANFAAAYTVWPDDSTLKSYWSKLD